MKSVSPGKGNFLSTISESKAPLVPRSLNHGHWGEKCDFDILQYTCPTNMSSEQGSRRSFRETFLRSTYPPMTSQSTSTDWRNRINSHQRYQLGAKKKERAHNVHELSIEPGKKKQLVVLRSILAQHSDRNSFSEATHHFKFWFLGYPLARCDDRELILKRVSEWENQKVCLQASGRLAWLGGWQGGWLGKHHIHKVGGQRLLTKIVYGFLSHYK